MRIMHLILEIARDSAHGGDGITKTKIMYGAYLSHIQAKGYLRVLTENGLLDYDQARQTFKTTEKGLRFLEIYNDMQDIMSKVEEYQLV
jgi:predicted transcriptional regulator